MDMLVDGEWRTDLGPRTDDEGAFEREETSFRDWIRDDPDAPFQPGPGRYHLYVARPCPWAHGAALVRALMGLEDVISMDVVDYIRESDGWEFSPGKDDCDPDSILGADYLREVYVAADPSFTGRVTVPVLWDRERETIVNNESIEIMRMLADTFREYGTNDVDLYPEAARDEIDAVIDDVYDSINNGVYRAGYSESQDAYEVAVEELFAAFEDYDRRLETQRYLTGEELTLADVRLFPTLVRFDTVYHYLFKCNLGRLTDYHNLWNYAKELYQLPGVAGTMNWYHTKQSYYRTKPHVNPNRIVPLGPTDVDFTEDHDRDRLPGGPPEALDG